MTLRQFVLVSFFFFFTTTSLFAEEPPKQPFKKGTIHIKKKTLTAEFAQTEDQQRYGLMNRAQIPDNFGMLFIFEDEDFRSFWMRNTFVDLSVAYIGANKKILEMYDMAASKSSTDANPTSYPSEFKAKYVLEVKQGWFKKNKIQVGDTITFTIKK